MRRCWRLQEEEEHKCLYLRRNAGLASYGTEASLFTSMWEELSVYLFEGVFIYDTTWTLLEREGEAEREGGEEGRSKRGGQRRTEALRDGERVDGINQRIKKVQRRLAIGQASKFGVHYHLISPKVEMNAVANPDHLSRVSLLSLVPTKSVIQL